MYKNSSSVGSLGCGSLLGSSGLGSLGVGSLHSGEDCYVEPQEPIVNLVTTIVNGYYNGSTTGCGVTAGDEYRTADWMDVRNITQVLITFSDGADRSSIVQKRSNETCAFVTHLATPTSAPTEPYLYIIPESMDYLRVYYASNYVGTLVVEDKS